MYENLEIIFDRPLLVGECPTWVPETGELLFVDINGKGFYRMDYDSGKYERTNLPQMAGCFAVCRNGDLLLGMEDGIYRTEPDGRMKLAHQQMQIKGTRFNDGKVGPDGCYYVGTMGADYSGAFYRLQGEELVELFDGCGISNGLDWSLDDKTLYYCDSPTQKVETFAFDAETHTLSDRRTLLEYPLSFGRGDGMVIDTEGALWVAVWGGSCVQRIEAGTGRVLQTIQVPAKQVACVSFAGDDLRDLIITTAAIRTDPSQDPLAGQIFRCRTDVAGRLFPRF